LLLADVKPGSAERHRAFFAPARGWRPLETVNLEGITIDQYEKR
jgi:hypothetical protein